MEGKQSQCVRFYTRKRKKNMSDLTTTSDKLLALPESLLHLILSFLDIKQVVQTSCLSTKWRNIWRSIPSLNFNYYFLNGLHNELTLTISGYGHKTSPGCANLLDQEMNTCSDLRCLEFNCFLPTIRDITILLKRFPYIETLRFACCRIEDMEEDWGQVLSIQNMFSHLKYIKVHKFNGCENEVMLLEYLLKSAPGLHHMIIYLSKAFSNLKKLDELNKKLHSFPRAASSNIILFNKEIGSLWLKS